MSSAADSLLAQLPGDTKLQLAKERAAPVCESSCFVSESPDSPQASAHWNTHDTTTQKTPVVGVFSVIPLVRMCK